MQKWIQWYTDFQDCFLRDGNFVMLKIKNTSKRNTDIHSACKASIAETVDETTILLMSMIQTIGCVITHCKSTASETLNNDTIVS
jgi:hypothetical protein